MEITAEQFKRIEPVLPVQRGNVSVSNLDVVNAILYVAENRCKWRALPKRFGNWHTIYTRINRWTKAGVLDRLFAELQRQQLVRTRIESVSLNSTIVNVLPDGTGAVEERRTSHRKITRRMDHEDSYGCRGCSNGSDLRAYTRPGGRRARRPGAAAPVGFAPQALPSHHGPRPRGQRDPPTGA